MLSLLLRKWFLPFKCHWLRQKETFCTIFRTRDVPGMLFIAVIALCSAFLLLLPLSPWVSNVWMNRFHLRGSYAKWAILQPIPSMYNFDNRVTLYNEAATQKPLMQLQINHHPARVVMDPFYRLKLRQPQWREPVWYRLESSYRGRTLSTVYRCENGIISPEFETHDR